MKKILATIMNLMAGFMDFGLGALIIALVAKMFEHPLSWWHLAIGGLFGLLPDIDVAFTLLRRTVFTYNHHTSPTHRPIILLPVATAIAYGLGGLFWAMSAFLCVLWHYCHDTPPLGVDGITWLWPLSDKYISYQGAREPVMSMGHPAFIQQYWVRPTPYSLWEISVGTVALSSAMLISGYNPIYAGLSFVVLWGGAVSVWSLNRHYS